MDTRIRAYLMFLASISLIAAVLTTPMMAQSKTCNPFSMYYAKYCR